MSRRSRPGWSSFVTHSGAHAVLLAITLGLPSAAAARAPGDPESPATSGFAAAPSPDPRWPWPIAPPIVVGRSFIAPATPYTAGHRGIDLTVGSEVDVRSPADGVVTFAGVVVDRPVLTIDVGDDLLVSFEPLEPLVVKGDRVARGEVVGRVAEGGHCNSECLHVGVRLRGAYISPLLFFDRVPRAVLLPLD
jgi:murein DD-endopeptidase MepM/ murein hydrolase activator NlpD